MESDIRSGADIGRSIRAIRSTQGLTQVEAAELAGIDSTYLSKIAGAHRVTPRTRAAHPAAPRRPDHHQLRQRHRRHDSGNSKSMRTKTKTTMNTKTSWNDNGDA